MSTAIRTVCNTTKSLDVQEIDIIWLRYSVVPIWVMLILHLGLVSKAMANANGTAGHSGKNPALTCAACHTGATPLESLVEGPTTATVGELMQFSVALTPGENAAPVASSGINVAVNGGELSIPDDEPLLRKSGIDLVQSEPKPVGIPSTSWKFIWKAPDVPGRYTVYIAGMLSNGDSGAGGDQLSNITLQVAVSDPGGASQINERSQASIGTGESAPNEPVGDQDQDHPDPLLVGGCQSSPNHAAPPLWCIILLGYVIFLRRTSRASIFILLAMCLTTWHLLQPASAAKKQHSAVIVAQGSSSSRLASMMKRSLGRKGIRIIPKRRYLSQARKAGGSILSTRAIRHACSRAGCDAVVVATVREDGLRYRLSAKIYDGISGRLVRRIVRNRGYRTLRMGANSLAAAVAPSVGSARDIAIAAARKKSGPAPKADRSINVLVGAVKNGKFAKPPPRARKPSKKSESSSKSTTVAQKTSPSPSPTTPTKKAAEKAVSSAQEPVKPPKDTNQSNILDKIFTAGEFLRISGAVGLAARDYKIISQDPNDSSRYRGSMYPEATLFAEIYPFSLVTRDFSRHIGLGFTYSHDISMSSTDPTAGIQLDTSSQEMIVDVRFRWKILQSKLSPVLLGVGGWGFRDFTVSDNTSLTSLNYQFFRIAGSAVVPLGTPAIAVTAGGGIRPVHKTGRQSVDSFGHRTRGFGWSAHGGLQGQMVGRWGTFFYFATIQYLVFTTQFAGLDAGGYEIRANSPDRATPTKGTDRFIRAWAGAGYAL